MDKDTMGITGIKRMGRNLVNLFYPITCAGCGTPLVSGEDIICLTCNASLPRTHFSRIAENEVDKIFWGRVNIQKGISFLYYRKAGLCQRLIAQLKYKNRREVGEFLGKMFGLELKILNCFEGDSFLLCPIPLHRKRLLQRGYNQSESICKGLSEALGIHSEPNLLKRSIHTQTQTRRKRYSRWQNTSEIFEIGPVKTMGDLHIILVDDIVTTGSTIESAAKVLQKQCHCKISVLTLGFAVSD